MSLIWKQGIFKFIRAICIFVDATEQNYFSNFTTHTSRLLDFTPISSMPLENFLPQPRECMRAGEVNTVARLETAFADLKCQNILGLGEKSVAANVLGPRRGGLPV